MAMKNDERRDPLERLIDKALRQLPPRKAPAGFAERVLAQVEARARPWWRKDFASWPVTAKLVFLIASAGVVRLVLAAPSWLRESSAAHLPPEVSWLNAGAQGLSVLMHHLPPFLIHGAAVALLALYIAFFGLGALAYRSLFSRFA